MGRYERAAKNSLKEATALASGIIESVRHDLRREEVRLEEEMTDRVQSIQAILNEVASIQDAIIAGSSEIKRELEKSKKKLVKYGDRELMITQIIGAATRLGELRTLHIDAVDRIQGALARPPSAVDIIERMTKDLLKLSGSWESSTREVPEEEKRGRMKELMDEYIDKLVSEKRISEDRIYSPMFKDNDHN